MKTLYQENILFLCANGTIFVKKYIDATGFNLIKIIRKDNY